MFCSKDFQNWKPFLLHNKQPNNLKLLLWKIVQQWSQWFFFWQFCHIFTKNIVKFLVKLVLLMQIKQTLLIYCGKQFEISMSQNWKKIVIINGVLNYLLGLCTLHFITLLMTINWHMVEIDVFLIGKISPRSRIKDFFF